MLHWVGATCGGLPEVWVNAKTWLGPLPAVGEIEKSLDCPVPIEQVVDESIVMRPEYPDSLIVRFVVVPTCAVNGDELAVRGPGDPVAVGVGDGVALGVDDGVDDGVALGVGEGVGPPPPTAIGSVVFLFPEP